MKAITVKELIDALKTLHPKALVAISSDSEGNSFSYIPNERYYLNDIYMSTELEAHDSYYDANEILTKKDIPGKTAECIILFPAN